MTPTASQRAIVQMSRREECTAGATEERGNEGRGLWTATFVYSGVCRYYQIDFVCICPKPQINLMEAVE